MIGRRRARLAVALLLCLGSLPAWLRAGNPENWVSARWKGGPLKVRRRTQDKALAANTALRDVITHWYDPATLALLQGTPINCILVTLSAGATPDLEEKQHLLAREYARAAQNAAAITKRFPESIGYKER